MRPRDPETGALEAPPHIRLSEAPALLQSALFAMANDTRAVALPMKRKLALAEKAIDHVVDGDAIPKWIHAPDPTNRDNHFLVDLWRLSVAAISAARRAA